MTTTIAAIPPAASGAFGLVKQSRGQAAITGTGSLIFTGLATVIVGSEEVGIANAAATVTTAVAMETGLSGVTVSVVVVALAAAANSVSAVAQNVNVGVWGF